MPGRADPRGFAWALGVSIALHAIVLAAWWPAWKEAPPVAASAPVVARLAEVQLPETPPAEAQKPEPPKPAPRPATRQKKPAPIAKAEPQAPAAAPAPSEPQAAPPASPPAAATASVAAPAPAEPDREAIEATSAAQYRLQLIGAARRYRLAYPQLARENNWSGNVVLEVVVRPDGRAELAMRRGSGHEVLDRQALDTYRRALRDVPVPASLYGRQLALEPLVVVYALKD